MMLCNCYSTLADLRSVRSKLMDRNESGFHGIEF